MMRLFTLLLLFIPVLVHAQEAKITIGTGDTIELDVRAEQPTIVEFSNDEAQYITIEALSLSDAIDPVLWVTDSQNRVLAYNDNFEDTVNSRIENLFLEAGIYMIFIDSFNGVTGGRASLSLSMTMPQQVTMEETEGDTKIRGFLLEDKVFTFPFPENIEGQVTVIVRDLSGTLDPLVRIVTSDGDVIVENDDHESEDLSLNTFDSRIAGWNIPDTGEFYVEIVDYLGQSGRFELAITGD